MTKRRRKGVGRRFIAMDHELIDHPAFMGLSARGKATVLLLLRRFNGSNNGKIPVSFRDIQAFVPCHPRNVEPTIKELEASRLAERTQKGVYRPGGDAVASLWRLTFLGTSNAPATHDYRRPASMTATTGALLPQWKRSRYPSGSSESGFGEIEGAENTVPATPLEAEIDLSRYHSGSICKVPGGASQFAAEPAASAVGVSGDGVEGGSPDTASKNGAPAEDEPGAEQHSEVARHDALARRLSDWSGGGPAPPGIGKRIRRWREAEGWTQAELAHKAGLRVSALCKMEREHQNMSRADYEALVRALAVDPLQAYPMLKRQHSD
jgi:hypothetical protein